MGANWSGSPVGPFDRNVSAIPAGAGAYIAAPGVGLSIYIQTVMLSGGGGGGEVILGPNGASLMVCLNGPGSNITFPGGFKVGDNTALTVVATPGGIRVTTTYTIGPTI